MTETAKLDSLGDLLAAMSPVNGQSHVSVRDILERIGDRSFAPAILIPALILVSPVSGVPGTPTVFGLIISLIALQALIQRRHLWLPEWLMRRKLSADRMTRAVRFLERPAAWMDRHSHGRLCLLTSGPVRPLAYMATTAIALSWPLLEILPFVTSFGAGAIAMIMFGLLTRDGLYVVLGYAQGTLLYLIILTVWSGLL